MHAFWNALADGRIVPEKWLAEMIRPHSDVPEEDARYGLGFWLARSGPAVKLVGGDAGASFYSAHDPAARWTWTVVSNTTGGAWGLVRHLQAVLGG